MLRRSRQPDPGGCRTHRRTASRSGRRKRSASSLTRFDPFPERISHTPREVSQPSAEGAAKAFNWHRDNNLVTALA